MLDTTDGHFKPNILLNVSDVAVILLIFHVCKREAIVYN